jgi:D-aspartate ligase
MMRTETSARKPGAIILGGNFVGYGVARSLGAHGIRSWVIDSDRSKSIAQFSKYTTRFIETKASVPELLLREGRDHDLAGWVIFAVTDEYVETISANHETLSSIFKLTTPPPEITKFALDKRLTYAKADELGIAKPWTVVGQSFTDITAGDFQYPLILKPAVNHHFFPQTNVKVLKVSNAAELQERYAQMSRYIPPDEIMIQECIPGNGASQFSFCGVFNNGNPTASLVARRRRQFPVDFGNASSFVETATQSVVEEAGLRFLKSIGFTGMAEIEFKFDVRDGKYKILDFNPRAWGWHTLGKAAGMDFAYLLWQQVNGFSIAETTDYRKACWIREITDFIAILKSGDRSAEIKSLYKAVQSAKVTSATFSFVDPLPFFAEFALWISSGVSRQETAKKFVQRTRAEVVSK